MRIAMCFFRSIYMKHIHLPLVMNFSCCNFEMLSSIVMKKKLFYILANVFTRNDGAIFLQMKNVYSNNLHLSLFVISRALFVVLICQEEDLFRRFLCILLNDCAICSSFGARLIRKFSLEKVLMKWITNDLELFKINRWRLKNLIDRKKISTYKFEQIEVHIFQLFKLMVNISSEIETNRLKRPRRRVCLKERIQFEA